MNHYKSLRHNDIRNLSVSFLKINKNRSSSLSTVPFAPWDGHKPEPDACPAIYPFPGFLYDGNHASFNRSDRIFIYVIYDHKYQFILHT